MQRESAAGTLSLLHTEGRCAPKSDSTPLRQSQNWESRYLFSSHWINNNIVLWTKTLSVSLCLLVSFLLRSHFPRLPLSLALSLSEPWQLFVSLLLSTSTCLQLFTQPEASCFFFLYELQYIFLTQFCYLSDSLVEDTNRLSAKYTWFF